MGARRLGGMVGSIGQSTLLWSMELNDLTIDSKWVAMESIWRKIGGVAIDVCVSCSRGIERTWMFSTWGATVGCVWRLERLDGQALIFCWATVIWDGHCADAQNYWGGW